MVTIPTFPIRFFKISIDLYMSTLESSASNFMFYLQVCDHFRAYIQVTRQRTGDMFKIIFSVF